MAESTSGPQYPDTGADLPDTAAARPSGPGSLTLGRATLGLGAAAVVAVGFLGGYVVKDATADERGFDRGMMVGPMGAGGPGGGGRPMMEGPGPNGRSANIAIGTVKSIDGKTVTLTTPDGRTTTVTIGSDASVMVTTKGTAADLAKGDEIVVHGQRDGDIIEADVVSKGGPFMHRRAGR